MAGLVPDLQHILFWMSNSVELLFFIQQQCPLYMQSLEEELDVTGTAAALPGGGVSGLGVASPHRLRVGSDARTEVDLCRGLL